MRPASRHRGSGVTVGIPELSEDRVVGEIVVQRLRQGGHSVAVVHGHHGALLPLLAQGDIDVLVPAWLPDGQRPLWDDFGRGTVPVHAAYKGARFSWAVTPGPGPAPQSVEDLCRPDASVVGRGILSAGAASPLTIRSRRVLDRYALLDAGFRVEPADQPMEQRALADALHTRRRVVFAVTIPSALVARHRHALRELDEPRSVLGGANEAAVVLSGDCALRASSDLLRCLRSIRLTVAEVGALALEVHYGRTLTDVASAWLDRQPTALMRAPHGGMSNRDWHSRRPSASLGP